MPESPREPAAATPPRVWLLIGDKLGDNAQAEALVRALGWPHETRRVVPRPEWALGKPRFRPGLHHLDPDRSDALEPPWPDLVVTIGRRPSMAALWVQDRSDDRAEVVLIGRPKGGWLDRFALVVAPSQFRVPPHPKVVHLDLPLMRADAGAVAEAAEAWRPRLEGLPRPLTGVLVGGRTKPYLFDAAVAGRLVDDLGRLGARDGGTLYVTTSRRTQPEVAAVLRERLPPGAALYDWAAEQGADNPYLALLGLADRLVVTGDSVSMMVEAASLGRPLAVFALPVGGGVGGLVARLAGRLPDPGEPGGVAARLTHLGHRLGLFGYARDLTAVHRTLYAKGLAVPLGEPFPPPRAGGGGLADELGPLAARIRALVA